MEKGITYKYDQKTKKLTPTTKKSTRGLTPQQRKTTEKNYKKDKTGSDPFYPIHT